MRNKLVTERVRLNGTRLTLTHSSELVLPKNIVSELKAENNKELQKLAREVIKL